MRLMNSSLDASRRRVASLAVTVTLLATTVTGGVAIASEMTAATVYPCHVTGSTSSGLTAGYYGGNTAVPSSTQVTAAGKEAQCLLKYMGPNPGTVDGVFGPASKNAARNYQLLMNDVCSAGLTADGIVGSKTWPYLRHGC